MKIITVDTEKGEISKYTPEEYLKTLHKNFQDELWGKGAHASYIAGKADQIFEMQKEGSMDAVEAVARLNHLTKQWYAGIKVGSYSGFGGGKNE